MKQVSWPQVALVLGVIICLVGGVCVLAVTDKDPAIILTLAGIIAVPVLGAFGVAVYQKLDQVREVTNGNLTRAHDMLDKHTQQTASALQANTEVISRLVDTLANNHNNKP